MADRVSPDQSSEKHEIKAVENSGHGNIGSHEKDMEAMKAQLAAAHLVDPGLQAGSWRYIRFHLIFLVVACCSGDSGFDSTVMSGVNAMKQYQRFFNLRDAGAKTSIVFGIYTIGQLTGAFPASYLPDKVGRRWAMLIGNVILICGAILTSTAANTGRFLGGRFLTGLGVALAGAPAKTYLAEITPPQHRGRYVGLLNCFYYVGQLTASGMMIATQKFNSNLAWRLPLWIQVVMPAINAGLILFCPESPRWLYSVGKVDQARTILAGLHSKTNDVNSPLIKHEMEEIERAILQDGADKRWWDFRPLFKTRAQRARMWMVVLVGAFGQLSGNGMVTYFLTVLLRIAGITDQGKQITLNFVNSVTSMIGAVTGAFIVDSFGRRRLLLTGTITLVVILAIASGLLSDPTTSQARANAGITFIYLFMVAFSFGWTPMQSLYPAEVLTFDMRTKGLALYTLVAQAASCINTFGLPVALDKMGFWCYVMFCLWDVFEVAIIYFTVVETKGLTLEEVEEVFENPNPVKYSKELAAKHRAIVRQARDNA